MEVVRNATFQITCVVVDKKEHKEKIYRTLIHPYHYCISALLERYAGWLEHIGLEGDVMAESRGKGEDEQLRLAFETTLERGTAFHSGERFRRVLTSGKIKLKKKDHDIAGLQLADLLAYPFKREMIAERRGEQPPADFSSRLLDAARSKINRHLYTGRIAGYGKVWLD